MQDTISTAILAVLIIAAGGLLMAAVPAGIYTMGVMLMHSKRKKGSRRNGKMRKN